MPDKSDESFQIDVEPVDQFLRHEQHLEREKAKTANLLALLLVGGVLGSLPIYLVAVWILPQAVDRFASGFDKWLTLVSTLAGTAIGAYYGARVEKAKRG